MQHVYPTPIQSSVNGSYLDLFTGIFYIIRIFGAGGGVIRPSNVPSANGGIYLEQDIFQSPDFLTNETEDALWYFEPASVPSFYEWGVYSEPKSRVAWAPGDTDEDFPLQLRDKREIAQDIYEDPSSTFWDFESYSLENLGYLGVAYKVRPMNLGQHAAGFSSVTFAPHPKSPRGWWLQLNNPHNVDNNEDQYDSQTVTRSTADHLIIFEPQNFKLYAEIAHMDLGNLEELTDIPRVKEYIRTDVLKNPSPNDINQNLTVGSPIEYNLYAQPDAESDLFSGITVINPKTTPSRKYFDFEKPGDYYSSGVLTLKATEIIKGMEEIELDAFSTKTVSSYVTYLKEFKGIKYFCWTDVYAVADMMGSNGRIVKNMLVRDVNLLKHLIRARGYMGEFREVPNERRTKDGAQIRIKTTGMLRGSHPIPFIQFEEGKSVACPKFEEEYRQKVAH